MKSNVITLILASFIVTGALAQTTPEEWYDKGMSLKNAEDYKGAITAFKKATTLKANYAQALHMLGWCYNEESMYNEAIDVLKKELKAGPENAGSTNFELGYAYKGLSNCAEAIKYFNKTIELNDDYGSAFKERGDCYFNLKKYEAALDDYLQYEAMEDDIDDATFYYNKGWVENDLEKYNDAIISLQKCIDLDDSYTDGYSEIGFAYYKLNKNDDAVRSYRMAMNQDPADFHPVMGMADVYYENIKDYDSSIVYYELATRLQKKNTTAYYRLGWCYNDKERYSLAIAPLKEAIALDATYDEAQNELGYAYYKLDQYDNALAQFKPVMARSNKDEISRYYAGLCYSQRGDMVSLKKMISELTGLNSKYVEELKKLVK